MIIHDWENKYFELELDSDHSPTAERIRKLLEKYALPAPGEGYAVEIQSYTLRDLILRRARRMSVALEITSTR